MAQTEVCKMGYDFPFGQSFGQYLEEVLRFLIFLWPSSFCSVMVMLW